MECNKTAEYQHVPFFSPSLSLSFLFFVIPLNETVRYALKLVHCMNKHYFHIRKTTIRKIVFYWIHWKAFSSSTSSQPFIILSFSSSLSLIDIDLPSISANMLRKNILHVVMSTVACQCHPNINSNNVYPSFVSVTPHIYPLSNIVYRLTAYRKPNSKYVYSNINTNYMRSTKAFFNRPMIACDRAKREKTLCQIEEWTQMYVWQTK